MTLATLSVNLSSAIKGKSMNRDATSQTWAERIGQQLRSRRKAQGLTLEDLSRLSGSTVPTLSHIERGTRDVKLSTLISLAEALRIDLPKLFYPQTGPEPLQPANTVGGYSLDDD